MQSTKKAPTANDSSNVQITHDVDSISDYGIEETGYAIYRTKNYDLFSILTGNRDVNVMHVKRLRDSFRKSMLFTVIFVNEHYQIIDGQHRFEVLKELGEPIEFIVLPEYGVKEVQILNTNSKNWKTEDYLQGYCKEGYGEYLKMKKFMEDYPEFGILATLRILTQLSTGKKQGSVDGVKVSSNQDFECGRFVVPDLTASYEIAEKLRLLAPYFHLYTDPTFISAILKVFANPEYDHNEMISKLSKQPSVLIKQRDVEQYRLIIEDVYNYRRRDKKVNLRY